MGAGATHLLLLRKRRKPAWSPSSFGSALEADYWAERGCYTDAACLFASASSQYLTKASPTFAPTTKMTIAFDYKATALAGTHGVVGRFGGSQNQFLFQQAAGGLFYLTVCANLTDNANYVQSSTTFAFGATYRIVLVYDGTLAAGSRVAMYVDGVDRTGAYTGTIPATLTTSTAPIRVGSADGASEFVDGFVSRLGFSSDALSGAALTAAHTSTFWADMTAARQADWFSFYNLCEASGTRVDSTGLNTLSATNAPGVAAGPGEGLCVDRSPCKRIEDQSGSGRHLAQADISKQYLWIGSAQNGKPGLIPAGATSTYTVAMAIAQPVTWFLAGNMPDNTGANQAWAYQPGEITLYRKGSNFWAMYGGATECESAVAADTGWHSFAAEFNGASSVLMIDGAASALTPSNPGSSGMTAFSPGVYIQGPGYFGRIFIVSRLTTAAEKSSGCAYLKSLYATP